MIPLNQRLRTVSQFIHHETLADIGSDHAYLPLYLLEQGQINKAIAGEVVQGPYEAAKLNVEKYNRTSKIEVRLGNGLSILSPAEVDAITICGMGGPLIKEILLSGKEKLSNYPTLVLQSNIHTEAVREAIVTLGYQIDHEIIMKEKKHIYEIIVCNKATQCVQYDKKAMKFGPFLLQEKNEIFKEKWERELKQLHEIAENIKNQNEHKEKFQALQTQIEMLKEVLM